MSPVQLQHFFLGSVPLIIFICTCIIPGLFVSLSIYSNKGTDNISCGRFEISSSFTDLFFPVYMEDIWYILEFFTIILDIFIQL